MNITKRTALGMLGLAATPIAGESFSRTMGDDGKEYGHGVRFGIELRENVACALRALADDIEKGGTYPEHIELRSSANVEEFFRHTLSIRFFMVDKPIS